jgi:hypothetical protein
MTLLRGSGWIGLVGALAAALLSGCAATPLPPTYTEGELRVQCERAHGWWHPDALTGGFCEHDSEM